MIPSFLTITYLRLPKSYKESFLVSISTLKLTGIVDVFFALDLEQRKLVTRYIFFLTKVAMYYKSKLQTSVATSATEA